MSPGAAVLAKLKDLGYWNGVVRSTALPLLKGLVESTDNKWDDALYGMAEGFLDKLLPPSAPALPPAA